MNRTCPLALALARPFAIIALFALAPSFLAARARSLPQDSQQADNSRNNQDRSLPTADQQKTSRSDQEITRNIRKAIIADKGLSTYAHNVKIITQNGKVTLRGPVRSDEEKRNVEAKAAATAGEENITDEVEVAPGK